MTDQKSILIVDDDWGIRALLTKFLNGLGYRVETAEDGVAGLNLAKSMAPDLIILDIRLPLMDGLTVARMIRGYKPISHTPIILMSVMDREDTLSKAAGLKIRAYVIKPFRVNKLLEVVQDILDVKG